MTEENFTGVLHPTSKYLYNTGLFPYRFYQGGLKISVELALGWRIRWTGGIVGFLIHSKLSESIWLIGKLNFLVCV